MAVPEKGAIKPKAADLVKEWICSEAGVGSAYRQDDGIAADGGVRLLRGLRKLIGITSERYSPRRGLLLRLKGTCHAAH